MTRMYIDPGVPSEERCLFLDFCTGAPRALPGFQIPDV